MTDANPLRPTPERLRLADHLADDGAPTKDQPYVRAARLGTAWDLYCKTKNRNGNPIPDHELTLTRAQIAAGNHYANDYALSMWGQARISKTEPSVSGGTSGIPAARLDARKAVWRAEAKLSRYGAVMLQCVIFDGMPIEGWAARTKNLNMPPIDYLRHELSILADHYGYPV